MTDVVLILTTVPVGEQGERIASALVEERLAACVNLQAPMTSVYRWEGALHRDAERQVVMKTVASRVPEIRERIVFCAHYDSKIDTPGAYDNAAGVGVLLTLAELFSGRKHRHTLEWVAFTGEEGAGLGDMEYARNARENQDGFDQVHG